MTEKRFFADVDLPFHVWVREHTAAGARWVLREAPLSPNASNDDADPAAFTPAHLGALAPGQRAA